MKLIVRLLMLIAVMAILIGGYYYAMRHYSAPAVSTDKAKEYQRQIMNSAEESLVLTGTLTRIDFFYYLDQEDKLRIPVISQQIDLNSYIDKPVAVKVRLSGDQLDIFQIEELEQ